MGLFSNLKASEKIYLDPEDLYLSGESFHFHIGENKWLETNVVHKDSSGLFTYSHNIESLINGEYKRTWKCPYCHHYWSIGTPCQNKDCPSKYK